MADSCLTIKKYKCYNIYEYTHSMRNGSETVK